MKVPRRVIVQQHHHLLQRSRSFWRVTLHDSRHLSQRLGMPCSSLTNTLTWTMMRNAWLSGTETSLLWTSWFIQHLEHLAYLQLVLPLSAFLVRVVLFYHFTVHACLTAYCLYLYFWSVTSRCCVTFTETLSDWTVGFMYKFHRYALFGWFCTS